MKARLQLGGVKMTSRHVEEPLRLNAMHSNNLPITIDCCASQFGNTTLLVCPNSNTSLYTPTAALSSDIVLSMQQVLIGMGLSQLAGVYSFSPKHAQAC